jgi:hypothetical protein
MTALPVFPITLYNNVHLDLNSLENSFEGSPDDLKNDYNPFRISGLQTYSPLYTRFLSLNNDNVSSVQLNHKYHIVNSSTVKDATTGIIDNDKAVFIKYSPLLDPIRYMIGKYEPDGSDIYKLPQLNTSGYPKIDDMNNAAYTDCFFYYLTSKVLHEYNFVHGTDFYGSFIGIQDKYKMNVADDIEYLNTSPFFNENLNKLFSICNHDTSSYYADSSRTNRTKLRISSGIAHNISAINLDDVMDIGEPTTEMGETETIYDNRNKAETSVKSSSNSSSGSSSNSSSDDNSDYNDSSDETEEDDSDGEGDEDRENDEDWETDSNEEGSASDDTYDDDVQSGYINKFPVQLICLEKCKGTIDELFLNNMLDVDSAAAALFQVIMTLIAYQKMFAFTHNDLHTNNIMYIDTDEPYLYYKYENVTYRVPTHGRIFKLIDFGRSIFKFGGNTICSDSFALGGDAATQYNCEPYYDNTKPRIEPNYSFDLCRLGCSIYDFIVPDEGEDHSKYDDLQKTIQRWCLDDRGKNVLYKRNGDERYPNFKLYKMVARTVNKHTPQAQLKYSYFKQFTCSDKKAVGKCMDIDQLPSCV